MDCLHVPFVMIGAPPFAGTNVLTTSHSPANCASSFCPAPGAFGGSYCSWVCWAKAEPAIRSTAKIHFVMWRFYPSADRILAVLMSHACPDCDEPLVFA